MKRSRRITRNTHIALALLLLLVAAGTLHALSHARAAALLQRPLLSPVDQVYPFTASPNYSFRPEGAIIDCVVLHATAQATLQQTLDTFLDPSTKRSAHFVVDRDGTVVQMVPVNLRAWHAGVSTFAGVDGVNDYSVGIEMVNLNDGKDPYTDRQYLSVARIISLLRTQYSIPDERIVSHAQVAIPPGRKSDPLGFNFARLRGYLEALPPADVLPDPNAMDTDPTHADDRLTVSVR